MRLGLLTKKGHKVTTEATCTRQFDLSDDGPHKPQTTAQLACTDSAGQGDITVTNVGRKALSYAVLLGTVRWPMRWGLCDKMLVNE